MVPLQDTIPYYEAGIPRPDSQGNPPWLMLNNAPGQDIMAWITRGAVTDRSTEKLGLSDEGIILSRRLLREQLDRVMRGEEPMNVFRDPAKNEFIPVPQEMRGGINWPFRAQGNSGESVWTLRNGRVEELYPDWINTSRPVVTREGGGI